MFALTLDVRSQAGNVSDRWTGAGTGEKLNPRLFEMDPCQRDFPASLAYGLGYCRTICCETGAPSASWARVAT